MIEVHPFSHIVVPKLWYITITTHIDLAFLMWDPYLISYHQDLKSIAEYLIPLDSLYSIYPEFLI